MNSREILIEKEKKLLAYNLWLLFKDDQKTDKYYWYQASKLLEKFFNDYQETFSEFLVKAIERFENIPHELWITNSYLDSNNQAKRCALGHCLSPNFGGCYDKQGYQLTSSIFIYMSRSNITSVNDNNYFYHYDFLKNYDHPKDRVIAFLNRLKLQIENIEL